MIKSALMNQKILAGIGNLYSDEILYQLKVNPREEIHEMNAEEIQAIADESRRVLKTIIAVRSGDKDLPDSYLLAHRKTGEECPRCGSEIERIRVSGRSSYYCPNCQLIS